ncbi:MAG: TlpA disulfide reductase family protein [Chitinophagales bacterium]
MKYLKYLLPVLVLAAGAYLYQKYRIPPTLSFQQLKLERLNGQPFDWAEAKGHPQLINFFQTWCGPCLHEMPGMIQAGRQQPQLLVVAISDEPLEKLRQMEARFGGSLLILHSLESMNRIGIHTWPTTYLINVNGSVVKEQTAAADWDDDEHLKMIEAASH